MRMLRKTTVIAAVALLEMFGETTPGVRVQGTFEKVRDDLDQVVAVDLRAAIHARASSM